MGNDQSTPSPINNSRPTYNGGTGYDNDVSPNISSRLSDTEMYASYVAPTTIMSVDEINNITRRGNSARQSSSSHHRRRPTHQQNRRRSNNY